MRTNKKIRETSSKVKPSLLSLLSPEVISGLQAGLYSGKPLVGKEGLLAPMIKELIELSVQGEMNSHLSESSLESGRNRRNGLSNKLVKSSVGEFELATPRDRNCSFEPELVKKRQTVLSDELDNKILSLYALGNSYHDIAKGTVANS